MKSFHVAAYTFSADIICGDCIDLWATKELMKEGIYNHQEIINEGLDYDVGIFAYRSEILLRKLAEIRDINLEDEYSWDSDDFPKIVFADQLETKEYCGGCGRKIP